MTLTPASRSLDAVLRDALAVPGGLRVLAGTYAAAQPTDRRYSNVILGGVTISVPNLNAITPGAGGTVCYVLADDTRMWVLGAPTSTPPTTGGLVPIAKAANYTAAANDNVIATGTITITSPAAAPGRTFGVHKRDAGTVTVAAATGVIRGPGLQATGRAAITLGQPGAYVVLLSDGTDWYAVAGGQAGAWQTIGALAGSWVAGSVPPAYMIDPSGYVHLRGAIKNGTAGVAAFTLPVGYRPATNLIVTTVQASVAIAALLITPAGVVTPYPSIAASNEVYMEGVAPFLAEN